MRDLKKIFTFGRKLYESMGDQEAVITTEHRKERFLTRTKKKNQKSNLKLAEQALGKFLCFIFTKCTALPFKNNFMWMIDMNMKTFI
jgi:hypothetical protein